MHLLCLLAALCSRRRSDWTFKEFVSPRVVSYLCQRWVWCVVWRALIALCGADHVYVINVFMGQNIIYGVHVLMCE